MRTRLYLSLASIAGLLIVAGCKTTPQMTMRPDFLSTYSHVKKVDDTTWRYVSPPQLANCNKFVVSPVKVLFNDFQGRAITAEERQRSSEFVRQAVTAGIAARYPVVSAPGPDVGEIRLAITEAYRTGGKLGLCVQGEILDNSNTQVAAVVHTQLAEYYAPGWEDKAEARRIVDDWVQRLVKVIDDAHGR